MKLRNRSRPALPVADYSQAIRNAVSWLGDRYVLATPIDPRSISRSYSRAGYFGEGRGWHERIGERHPIALNFKDGRKIVAT